MSQKITVTRVRDGVFTIGLFGRTIVSATCSVSKRDGREVFRANYRRLNDYQGPLPSYIFYDFEVGWFDPLMDELMEAVHKEMKKLLVHCFSVNKSTIVFNDGVALPYKVTNNRKTQMATLIITDNRNTLPDRMPTVMSIGTDRVSLDFLRISLLQMFAGVLEHFSESYVEMTRHF